ncbi:MAG: hypothetical protein JO025_11005 [Verrucomicrobia bacterium]|nr:hypothetical protein [Verrucomicrobiota bacterium]
MKSKALFLFAAILVSAGLLGPELKLLVDGWTAAQLLDQENKQQEITKNHLEGEIEGLRISKARIEALYTRLSDTMIASRGTSSLHLNSTPTAPLTGDGSSFEVAGITGFTQAGLIVQPVRVPNGEMSIIYEAGTADLEFHRLVPLLAEQENADLFLYFDKVLLSRSPNIPPFTTEPTYLETRLTIRMLTGK